MSPRVGTTSVTIIVTDDETYVPLVGARIREFTTPLTLVTDVNGRAEIPAAPAGTYVLECREIGYLGHRVTVTLRAGEPATIRIRLQRAGPRPLDVPIILLPLRLELRRFRAGDIVSLARLQYQPRDERRVFHRFVAKSPVSTNVFAAPEYWIRWFPDDAHTWRYVGAFDADELTEWNRFAAVVANCTVIPSDIEAELRVYYGLEAGWLSADALARVAAYEAEAIPLVSAGSHVRQILSWQDLDNPRVRAAWESFARTVGPVRARLIAREQTRASTDTSWLFDSDASGSPLAFHASRGAPMPTMPEKIFLYTVDEAGPHRLLEDIAVATHDLRLAPTEIDNAHWTVDFDKAVEMGMGVRVSDPALVAQIDAANWLIAVGESIEGSHSRALNEVWRRASASGELSLVAQGTPTNNAEQATAGYVDIQTDATEYVVATRMNASKDFAARLPFAVTDAELLAPTLDLDPSTLSVLPGGATKDQAESAAMLTLIWRACTAAWPVKEKEAIGLFVLNQVRGAGPLPAVRLGRNPYGVLPVVASRGWQQARELIPEQVRTFVDALRPVFLELAASLPCLADVPDAEKYDVFIDILRRNGVSNKLEARTFGVPIPELSEIDPRAVTCQLVADLATPPRPANADEFAETAYLWDILNVSTDANSPALERLIALAMQLARETHFFAAPYLAAAEVLRRVPPTRVATLFLQTLDLFSHRFDAWATAMATARLRELMSGKHRRHGLGAYGWLEKPGAAVESSAAPEFIQTPSVGQAVTAAVMRSAATNSGVADRSTFLINLESSRARCAEQYLDALRKQHLPEEVLGAELERLIRAASNDASTGITEGDIYVLRNRYPLTLENSTDGDGNSTETHTVIHGLDFLDKDADPRFASLREQLGSIRDAAGDVSLWEGMDQLLKRNYDRAAAWFDFMNGECPPPELESTLTSRSGRRRRTKVVLLFASSHTTGVATSLRSRADPLLAALCDALLPGFRDRQVPVSISPLDGTGTREVIVTAAQLGFEPIDLIVGGLEELRLRARYHVLRQWAAAGVPEATSPFALLGAYPELGETDEPLHAAIIDALPDEADSGSCSVYEHIEKASHIRRVLLEGRRESAPRNVSIAEMPLLDDGTIAQIDTGRPVSLLSARVTALANEIGGIIADLVEASFQLSVLAAAREGFAQSAKDARRIIGSSPQGDDTTDAINVLKARLELLEAFVAPLGNLSEAGTESVSAMASVMTATDTAASVLALNALAARLESATTQSEVELRGAGASVVANVAWDQLALWGIDRARAPLPVAPNLAICQRLIRLIDDALVSLGERARATRDVTPSLDNLSLALAAVFRRPLVAQRVLGSSFGSDELADAAIAAQLQISEDDQAPLLRAEYATATNLPTIVRALAGRLRAVNVAWSSATPQVEEMIPVLRGLTGSPSLPVLSEERLTTTSGSESTWRVSLVSLPNPPWSDLDRYSPVRSAVHEAVAALGVAPRYRLYAQRGADSTEDIVGDVVDYLYLAPAEVIEGNSLAAIDIDSWVEGIPNASESTGVAVRCPLPQAEAPNVIIVAVPPRVAPSESWTSDLLADVVVETIELMKIRTVESYEVLSTGLAQYMPALFLPPGEDGAARIPTQAKLLWDYDTLERAMYMTGVAGSVVATATRTSSSETSA